MEHPVAYCQFRCRTCMLTAVYLFIVVTHLFFAPLFSDGGNMNHNSVIKRNTEFIYNLIRTDRCLVNESKKAEITAKNHFSPFISLLLNTSTCSHLKTTDYFNCQFISDHHFTYLSNRVLRL